MRTGAAAQPTSLGLYAPQRADRNHDSQAGSGLRSDKNMKQSPVVRVAAGVLCLTAALIVSVAWMPSRAAESLVEQAFADYAAGDIRAISRIIPANYFDGVGRPALRREVDTAVSRWTRDRRQIQAVFLLDLARFGLVDLREPAPFPLDPGSDPVAVEVIAKARVFVTGRPDAPGRNPREDAFEIAWHKTAIALLGGMQRPDLLEKVGVAPLRRRMAASPPARGDARLIDPWIELAGAIQQEQSTIVDPRMLASAGPAAVRRFDEAARFGESRSEALVRKSWLCVRLGRYAEALAALDALGAPGDVADEAVRYWSRLSRGRSLAGLGRDDEAARRYEEALAIFPGAQTPLAALTAIEVRRGNVDAAYRWAAQGRAAALGRVDPWLQYGAGDYRHFQRRLDRLREAGR